MAGRRAKLAAWIIPCVLLAVFAHQTWRLATSDLSRWKGGGFGMFSTADRPKARFLRIYLIADGERIAADPGRQLRARIFAQQVDPDDAALRALARDLADIRWRRDPPVSDGPATARIGSNLDWKAGEAPVTVDAVQVEVWRLRFNGASAEITSELIRGVEFAAVPRT